MSGTSGHAVVRRVQRLDGHRVGLPGGGHLVDELGDGARAAGAHQRDRRDQPPAGGQAAPRRRSGCARRRHPHLLAELPQQAQIGVRRSRADHGDLVRARRRAQERERSGVRAGERRVGQIGKDEEDAHGQGAPSRPCIVGRSRWYHPRVPRAPLRVRAPRPSAASRSMLNAASGVTMYGVFSSLLDRERRGVVPAVVDGQPLPVGDGELRRCAGPR